jgi:hypothetical protein
VFGTSLAQVHQRSLSATSWHIRGFAERAWQLARCILVQTIVKEICALPIELSLQPNGDYLRIEVSGTRVKGEFGTVMLKLWERVANECQLNGFRRVLGISRVTGPVPTSELYEVAAKAPPMLRRAGCKKVAYVVLGGNEALRALKFGEDVAVSHRFVARVFADESSATAWLMEP